MPRINPNYMTPARAESLRNQANKRLEKRLQKTIHFRKTGNLIDYKYQNQITLQH